MSDSIQRHSYHQPTAIKTVALEWTVSKGIATKTYTKLLVSVVCGLSARSFTPSVKPKVSTRGVTTDLQKLMLSAKPCVSAGTTMLAWTYCLLLSLECIWTYQGTIQHLFSVGSPLKCVRCMSYRHCSVSVYSHVYICEDVICALCHLINNEMKCVQYM